MRIFFLCLFIVALSKVKGDCVWDKDTDFSEFPPLLINEATWKTILPVLSGSVREVRLSPGTSVVIACPGTTISATGTDVAVGVCEDGDVLNVDGSNYDMKKLGCDANLSESIQKDAGSCGDGGEGSEQIIGFAVTGYPFYELITVCFGYGMETIIYAYHVLRGESVSAADTGASRPSFKSSSGYFSVSVSTCYETNSQSSLMGDILGDSSIIDFDSSYYFARGHMAPDADFVTNMEADATYYYINAVPQWQIVNNGNWKYVETAVRDLAASHGTDLEIWTGPWRVLELDDTSGNPVEIYLGLFEGGEVIPAPELTWKVIYEPSSNRGVAIISVNNPYVTSFPTRLCIDICNQISWINFDIFDLEHGATYCCPVSELKEDVPNVPDLGTIGLLDS